MGKGLSVICTENELFEISHLMSIGEGGCNCCVGQKRSQIFSTFLSYEDDMQVYLNMY